MSEATGGTRGLAERTVRGLAAAGVDALFGLPGGGPNLEKIGAAAEAGMRFVLSHAETAACIEAATYGLLTGTAGVSVVTRGPGVASAVNGAAQATLDRFPLVLVSDTVPAELAGRVAHQRISQRDLLRPVTKWSGTLGTNDPTAVARAAAALAVRSPAGAVHLDFDPTAPGDPPPDVPDPPTDPDPRAMDGAVRMAAAASRPVFVVGAEAIPWTEEVRRAIRASGCPALTTYQAKGIVPDSWPSSAGLFTNGAVERPLLERADLVVAVGLDPVEPLPGPWRYRAPVLAIQPRPVADRYLDPEVEVVGSVGPALEALASHLRGAWSASAGRDARAQGQRSLFSDAPGLTPHEVVLALRDHALEGTQVTVDAGAHMLVAMPLWDVEEPRDLLISNGLATMGFALPAAIGAALARPGRPVVCLVGDGGLGMTLSELETVVRLGLDITTVVFNDSALSLIEIKQAPHQGGPAAVRYGLVDFAMIARAVGMGSRVVTDRAELEGALRGDRAGPRLIDARIDPSVYPHVMRATRG